MKLAHLWVMGSALALVVGTAGAQGPSPVLRHTFDQDEGGWSAQGANARATLTQQTTFNGKGALKYEYDLKPGAQSMLVLPTPERMLAGVRTLRLWLHADYPTTVAVLLQEQDGGRYTAVAALPKDRWQEVALSTADFVLAEGANDPRDPDGRLDMDRVGNVAIADVLQMFGVAGNAEAAKLLDLKQGPHALCMDDFTATAESLPPSVTASGGEVRIDTFVRPHVAWFALGASVARVARGAEERGLQADYTQAAGRIAGLMRSFPRGKLQGLDHLGFKASATRPTTLVVQLEEVGGGKFNAMVSVQEGAAAQPFSVSFADLTPADDSKVKDRKVKPELVTQLTILDASGMMGLAQDERQNSLYLAALRAYAGK